MNDAGTSQAEQSPPSGSEQRSPGHGVSSDSTSQRSKDLGSAYEGGRNDPDGSFTCGQGSMQRSDKSRKLTTQCKVCSFI
jgi:hypothetical protein